MTQNTTSNNISRKNYIFSITIIGLFFFIFGFVTWLNGILIPFLRTACELNDFEAYFVTFAFYISYFVMALPSSAVLKKTGFKNGMTVGLWVMAAGALIFIPAAMTRTFGLFLTGLFVEGAGLALLQTASNPYITIIGPRESAAKRISIMGIANKFAGAIAPIILASIILKDANVLETKLAQAVDAVTRAVILDEMANRVIMPYIVMTIVLVILGLIIRLAHLPEVDTDAEDQETGETNIKKTSIWQFPHLLLGVVALFFYVGVEVIAGDTIIRYGQSLGIAMSSAKYYTSLALLGMILGYIMGIIFIPKYLKQVNALRICTILGVIFSLGAILIPAGLAFKMPFFDPMFGFIAGWMIDRYGPRLMLMSGALMAGAALIGLSFMNSLWMFYAFYILNALGYVFGGPLPCQVLISKWFDKNRGKAMGIAYLGIGTGGALVPLISAGLEKNMGWHYALCSLGILVILIAFPFSFFIKDSPSKSIVQKKTETVVPIKNILLTRNFYLLAIGSMCSIGAVGGTNQHLKLYLRDLNFTQSQAAHVMSFVLLSSLAGRVLMGWLADLIHRKYVMILIYLIVASAIPLLLLPDFPGRVYIFAVIFGIGLGGDYMIIPLIAGDLFGVKALGRTMGIILVADGMSESFFPMLVGALYNDVNKSYALGFIVLICLAVTGAIIVSFLPKSHESKGFNSIVEHG